MEFLKAVGWTPGGASSTDGGRRRRRFINDWHKLRFCGSNFFPHDLSSHEHSRWSSLFFGLDLSEFSLRARPNSSDTLTSNIVLPKVLTTLADQFPCFLNPSSHRSRSWILSLRARKKLARARWPIFWRPIQRSRCRIKTSCTRPSSPPAIFLMTRNVLPRARLIMPPCNEDACGSESRFSSAPARPFTSIGNPPWNGFGTTTVRSSFSFYCATRRNAPFPTGTCNEIDIWRVSILWTQCRRKKIAPERQCLSNCANSRMWTEAFTRTKLRECSDTFLASRSM